MDLFEAVKSTHVEDVRKVLEAGADVNAWGKAWWTPLHHAVASGQKEIAELLIAKGANVNAKSADGWTPLWRAVYAGHKEISELLVTHGAGLNSEDVSGETPLHRASLDGHKEIAELLIAHGAEAHSADDVVADLRKLLEEGRPDHQNPPGFFRQVADYFWGVRDELSNDTIFKDGVYLIFITMLFSSMLFWATGQPLLIIPCILVVLISLFNKFWVNTGVIAVILVIDGYYFVQSWPKFWYMHVVLQGMGLGYMGKCFMAGKFSKGSLSTGSKDNNEVSEEAVNDLAHKIAWSITQSEIAKGNLKESDQDEVDRPHAHEVASALLTDAATFFRTVGAQKESLKDQLEENAKVFLQVADLVETNPRAKIGRV